MHKRQMIVFLLAYAAAIQAPFAKPIVGAADVPKVFSYDDYPEEAVRNHWQGDVVVGVTVNAEGLPTACEVVRSSGHQVLDDATCRIVMRRARFKPGTDANGKPVADRVILPPIRWRMSG